MYNASIHYWDSFGGIDVSENLEHKRLMWHCRRGMLELDVLLLPFCREVYLTLSSEDQAKFVDLLECEDPDLFAWFMQHQVSENPNHDYMVKLILKAGKIKI
jgi:antitoxin CptB